MFEVEAVEIAWQLIRTSAVRADGLDSVRFLSPSKFYRDSVAKGADPSQFPKGFAMKPDYWAVHFKLRVPDGACQSPDTVCVVVDDATGAAEIRTGM